MEDGILDISDFRQITGLELTDEAEIAAYKIANRRATNYLYRLLGWKCNYRGSFEETAIARNPNTCPTEEQYEQWQSDAEEYPFFEPAGSPSGDYKLFPFHPEDTNYLIDPATAVYDVKIVKVRPGDNNEFFTTRVLSPDDWEQKKDISLMSGSSPMVRWIEICKSFMNECECNPLCAESRKCWTLCVDGDWVRTLPDELKYILAEMILNSMNNPATLNIGSGSLYPIASESVDGHSVSYATSLKATTLDTIAEDNQATIMKYIGPFSPLYRGLRVL